MPVKNPSVVPVRLLLRLQDLMERWLYSLATFGVPVLIAAVTLLALLFWAPQYPTASHARIVSFQALEDVSAKLVPETALVVLQTRPVVSYEDTHLSEKPYWFLFNPLDSADLSEQLIEFPSRHAVELRCWSASDGLRSLGLGRRDRYTGQISSAKAGFQLALPPTSPVPILCSASFIGPARLTLAQWSQAELNLSIQEFHRNAGLLDGGLIVLALFVFITALISRNSSYVVFSVWLVINLRMAALSSGWDQQWLEHMVPQEWLIEGRKITIALYYVLTLVLFTMLFRDELIQVGQKRLVQLARWSCWPLLGLALFSSYSAFLPIIWVATGLGVVLLIYLLILILHKTRSQVAMWYAASIAVALFASLYEVISASFGFKGLIFAVNSVTAALASSLLASLALAAQMRQEHDQRLEMQAKLQQTYDAMPIGLFTLDLEGHFLSANPALRSMLGAGRSARDRLDAWSGYFNSSGWQQLLRLVHAHQSAELEIDGIPGMDGSAPRRYLVKAALVRERIEGSLQDVTEMSRATQHLQFLANNDSLTKVLNRRGIEKILDRAIASVTHESPLALAYLDLDRFKLINDLFGHSAGDEVLQQVCSRVNAMLSNSMSLGRVGGDEFVIVMPDTRLPLASVICQGLISSIGQAPYRVGSRAFQVRSSIGLIEVTPGTSTSEAISTVDRACRLAKSGQNNGLVAFGREASVHQEHEAELRLVGRLSSHTEIDGLFLEMQPIMSLSAPFDSLNFEVLVRMLDPQGERIPTERLITAGENSGRMGVIDRWVLSSTLSWLSDHRDQLGKTQFVCLNLSGSSLNDEHFIEEVFVLLDQYRDISRHLCLEITESVALHDLNNTRRFIDRVRQYGVKVALDDFGAGYTSFAYLKDLPGDLLKIDGSFIVNMNQHPANVAIVEAIVNLARNLGMKTVAEWAEDCETVQTLVDIGVDYVQGYAVTQPLPPSRLLSATSSASFIQDPALRQFIDQLPSTLAYGTRAGGGSLH
jgi:diguanylate cyclase (GGDEF)-like protein